MLTEENSLGINVPIFLGDNEKDTATDRTAPPRLVPKLPHRRHDRETVAERSISKRRINQTSAEKVPIPEPSPVLQIQSQPLVLLSEEQKRIYDHILAGKNTFFSGPAGSGKSLIIKHVLRDSPDTSRIAITAPTGVAAILIDGKTVHSWSGLGKAEKGLMYYTNEFTPGSKNLAINRWNGTELLILDEVSMVHPDLFETLNMIGKIARGSPVDLAPVPSTKPFGGLQLVVSGDFFQLPPVDPDTGRTCFMCGMNFPKCLCFHSLVY